MSITVSNKEAIEVVAKFAKAKDMQPGEAAGHLIVYAGKRLEALRKYGSKKGKPAKAPKAVIKKLSAAAKGPGKTTTVGAVLNKAVTEGVKAVKAVKAVKELDKISKILRSQEAAAAKRKNPIAVQKSGKAGVTVGMLPTLVFEDTKKSKKAPKTSFSKKFQ